MRTFISTIIAASAAVAIAAQGPPAAPPQDQPRQSDQIVVVINGPPGLSPKYAVPDFIALTSDAETVAAAKTIGQVLWDDLNFEREFYLIPRDTYRTIAPATSVDSLPLDQWKQLGTDGLIIGTVRKTPTGVYGIATLRLVSVNVRFGTPASCRSFLACPREALMSFEKPG